MGWLFNVKDAVFGRAQFMRARPNMNGPWKHFNAVTDPLIVGLDTELISMLDMAREKAGVPFIITSGRRTQIQNAQLKGSAQDSAHVEGLAVDLEVGGDDHVFNRILSGLYASGFTRFGLYFKPDGAKLVPHHIHVDISKDADKPQNDTWSLIEEN